MAGTTLCRPVHKGGGGGGGGFEGLKEPPSCLGVPPEEQLL